MSSAEIAVAIGSAGSATGLGALRSLARWSPRPRLLACDTNPAHLVAASDAFDFLQIEPANSDGFAETLGETLAGRGFTAFYPIHDIEVAVATDQRATFQDANLTVLAASAEAVRIVRDKLHMAQVFKAAGVPGPATARLDEATWDGTPLHYKPRSGVGSHGVGMIHDAVDFASAQMREDADQFIAQPFIEGQEITIDAFCPAPGDVRAIACRERVEVKAGVSTKARIFADKTLHDLTAAVSQTLGLTGSFCHQVRGTAQVGWQVIDVNPRIGGGTAMSVAAGLDFPSAHAAHFLGLDPSPYLGTLPDTDVFVTRSYQEHVTWPKSL